MTTVTLLEAKRNLEDLVHNLSPGEEIVIFEHDRAIARIVLTTPKSECRKTRSLGFLAGSVTKIDTDFDAPLEDMRDHMQ